jgi:hypothetical protein
VSDLQASTHQPDGFCWWQSPRQSPIEEAAARDCCGGCSRALAEVPRKERSIMNGFLVTGSCTSDDVPLYFIDDQKEADAFAMVTNEEDILKVLGDILKRDNGNVLGVDVTEFRNGKPVSWRRVKTIND